VEYREPERFELGAAIRIGRMVRGFTQLQLSDLSGVPLWRLQVLERGYKAVRPEEFLRLWACLSSERYRGPEQRPARETLQESGLVPATPSAGP
jgi:hypothetical protein